MRSHECCGRVAGNHAVALPSRVRLEPASKRSPNPDVPQALRNAHSRRRWVEKRGWIGGVKHHRQTKRPALLEDRREPLIVDAQQFAIGSAQRETEVLPELDAAGAVLNQPMEAIHRCLNEVISLHAVPVIQPMEEKRSGAAA